MPEGEAAIKKSGEALEKLAKLAIPILGGVSGFLVGNRVGFAAAGNPFSNLLIRVWRTVQPNVPLGFGSDESTLNQWIIYVGTVFLVGGIWRFFRPIVTAISDMLARFIDTFVIGWLLGVGWNLVRRDTADGKLFSA